MHMKTFLKAAITTIAVIAISGSANAGRRIETSQLPQPAMTFITTHYQNIGISECEMDGNVYEIELANGVDIEFNNMGKIMKIDGGRHLIGTSVLKAILPANTYNDLNTRKVLESVEEVKFTRKGIKVELRDAAMDEYYYSVDGSFIRIDN